MGFRREPTEDGARVRRIRCVLWVVLVLNLLVALSKLVYGMLTSSVAMEADGFHSLFDGASNVIGLVGLAAATRAADRGHPYGHGKYEAYASAAIGAMLLVAAWKVGGEAATRLLGAGRVPRVDAVSFGIMLGTLAVNLFVTTWERRQGRVLRSDLLLADAGHTGSDVVVSLGVLGSLLAVRLGYPVLDPIIALGVAGFIVVAAWKVFRRVNDTLMDQPRIPEAVICGVVLEVEGVLGCHSVRTRGAPSEVCVDLHVQVDPGMTVAEGHGIAERVERAVCGRLQEVVDVIVHLEPLDPYQEAKTAEERDPL